MPVTARMELGFIVSLRLSTSYSAAMVTYLFLRCPSSSPGTESAAGMRFRMGATGEVRGWPDRGRSLLANAMTKHCKAAG